VDAGSEILPIYISSTVLFNALWLPWLVKNWLLHDVIVTSLCGLQNADKKRVKTCSVAETIIVLDSLEWPGHMSVADKL